MSDERLSARAARRIAIAAQGLASPPVATEPNRRRLLRLIDALGALQLDSVNVVVRSHYLPAFSRLGAYDRALLEAAAWGPRPDLFEYWGHMASLMPVASQPLLRWRMERARAGGSGGHLATFGRERRDLVGMVLRRIEVEGPLTGGDFADGPRKSGWWNWSDGKRALEWLFWAGLITTRTRRGFERVYDLTERVIPNTVLDARTPTEADAQRALLQIASRALGIATAGDLRDYFRMPVEGFAARVAELVEDGCLTPVTVEGWRHVAYIADGARRPRQVTTAALLSPFDSLIWHRERAERLFGTRIRLEIYTPAHRREHGYYVLPLLVGDAIVARVDLKADRNADALLVQAAHLEEGADSDLAISSLATSLRRLSDWLGLGRVVVADRGDLAKELARDLG